MIFLGEPNLFVRISNKYIQRVTGKKGFYFDENGRFETNNELLIKALKQNFNHLPNYVDFNILWWTEENEENNADNNRGEEIKKFQCKKCEATFDNWGLFMSHCRQEHPKEG